MNEPTMETLARRGDRMEREHRRLKKAGVALAVIAVVVLMGQTDAVEAREGRAAVERDGMTALLDAAKEGDTARVRALIAEGVDVNSEDRRGRTPLDFAAARGHTDTVRALLAAGADVNAKDKYGLTALIYAAQFGHTAIVRALLAAGADVNAKDKGGGTALDAEMWGHTAIVRILKEAGARDMESVDSPEDSSHFLFPGIGLLIFCLLVIAIGLSIGKLPQFQGVSIKKLYRSPPSAQGTQAPEISRLTTGTTLYGKPDAHSPQLAWLQDGVAITVLEPAGDFLRVSTADNKVGYVIHSTAMTRVESEAWTYKRVAFGFAVGVVLFIVGAIIVGAMEDSDYGWSLFIIFMFGLCAILFAYVGGKEAVHDDPETEL